MTRIWAKRGSRPRKPRDQRYKWAYLFGAACPERRVGAALVLPMANAQAMNEHLKIISAEVAPGAHAALIMDNAGYHLAGELTYPDNITPAPLPPYSPELNSMENVWAYIRANKLAITVFDDYQDIVKKTCQAWMFFANDPQRIHSVTSRQWAQVKT